MSTKLDPTPLILRRELVARIERNPHYSLRAFARDLGVTHAYLSMLINGKRRLSVSVAARLEESLARKIIRSARASALSTVPLQSRRSVDPLSPYFALEMDRVKL